MKMSIVRFTALFCAVSVRGGGEGREREGKGEK